MPWNIPVKSRSAGIVLPEHRDHLVDQRTGEGHFEADVGVHDLDLDVVTDDATDVR